MDEQLAQIYGTGMTDAGDDLQKTAAAELLVKLAADNGIDLDQLSDEQVAGMIQELYKTAAEGETSGEESKEETKESKEESKEPPKEEGKEQTAQAKFAEADFLGRVMAHAYAQELGFIQKEAKGSELQYQMALHDAKTVPQHATAAHKAGPQNEAAKYEAMFGKARKIEEKAPKITAGQAVKGHAINAANKVKAVAGRAGELVSGSRARALAQDVAHGGSGGAIKHLIGEKRKVLGTRAALGAGAALLAAKALSGGKGKEHTASALDTLASQRAYELAKEAGWVDESGQLLVPEQEVKQASPLELAVEQRALEMLEAEGLPVEWAE